jgi:uncharacterized protein (UPF0335 family)
MQLDLDKAKLLQYVERIETYNDTIADATASKKEIMEEAKADGFSPKGINYIIKQRKKDRDQIAEEQELFSAYSKAAGL